MSARLLLKGGRVVDPSQGIDETLDLLVGEAGVEELGPRLSSRGATVVDVAGLVVCPGFIDLRTHLGEPGHEDRETVRTGTRAAAAGGFTAVCALPGTDPVNDQAGSTRALLDRARLEGITRLHPVGALSRGLRGEELAEYGDLRDAGCVAVCDDERPVHSARLLRRALEYAKAFDLVVIDYCEEPSLTEKAVMNEGPVATLLGLRGSPAAAESVVVERDLQLAELTSGRLHVARVSTAASVEAIRRAKARGVRVTAEATPHHLLLTDQLVKEREYDTAAKVRPPLRAEADRRALVEGLRDGTLDCIASDHSPRTVDEKKVEFDQAAFGVSSLETTVALGLDRLVHSGVLELEQLAALLSTNPAKAFGLPGGSLRPGSPADVTVLDLSRKRQVDPKRFESKGRSTPFAGEVLKGWPALTVVAGKVVFGGRDRT